MKTVIEIRDCEVKSSPECTKTFERLPQRGRPFKACIPCRELKPVKVVSAPQTEPIEGKCPCGATFTINPGRGRKPSKCAACREAGKVYRADDDGIMQEVRAEQLKREFDDRKREAGKERAMLLFLDMKKLIVKDSERRKAWAG